MAFMPSKLLFVAAPWQHPNMSSLALGTLCTILRAQGVEVDELHGSVLFPVAANSFGVLEQFAKFLFVPALTGRDVESLLDEILAIRLQGGTLEGIRIDPADANFHILGINDVVWKSRFRQDIAAAEVCLDLMFERVMAGDYDIIAFSTLFDDQMPAALALARRIRQARPAVKVIFGGAACFEDQAEGLISSFPEIDVVCHTEGDAVIVPLIAALRGQGELADVPGIVWRDGDGTLRRTGSPALLRDLDSLPMPDFGAFMEQYAASHWARDGALKPKLMFETSRGCWWGQKSLCTFCGLNGEGLAFRAKTPERAYQEIKHLYEAYPSSDYLQSTDNILDHKYLSTVFPRLAQLPKDPGRPLQFFYEVKPNMKAEQIEAMAAGGVTVVQAGIESFSDGVLELMRKGCIALGQVEFLKWAHQAGIKTNFNIILRNPGDKVEWYREMMELLPFITHLPPPAGITTMHLERFSPYHQNPAAFGITNVRPRSFYRTLYPGDGVDLGRIAYQFDFDHPSHQDQELMAAYRECHELLRTWRDTWTADTVFYTDEGDHLLLTDRRDGDPEVVRLTGTRAQLFVYLDHHRSRSRLAQAFPRLDGQFLDTLLLAWQHRRWICCDGDRWLAVVPRKGPKIMRVEIPRPAGRSLPTVSAAMGAAR